MVTYRELNKNFGYLRLKDVQLENENGETAKL